MNNFSPETNPKNVISIGELLFIYMPVMLMSIMVLTSLIFTSENLASGIVFALLTVCFCGIAVTIINVLREVRDLKGELRETRRQFGANVDRDGD